MAGGGSGSWLAAAGSWLVIVVFLVECRGGVFMEVGRLQPNTDRVVVM